MCINICAGNAPENVQTFTECIIGIFEMHKIVIQLICALMYTLSQIAYTPGLVSSQSECVLMLRELNTISV